MNLKFMLLSAILLTLSFNQAQAITQITSDGQFQEIADNDKAVIAVGSESYQLEQLTGLVSQLTQLEGKFPGIVFAYAFTEDIPASVAKYQLGGLGVLLCKNNNHWHLQAPISTQGLANYIAQYIGDTFF